MKTFFSIIFKLILAIVAFWALIAFLQWDESDRENAVTQLLPFELNYTFEGEANSYKDGNAWFARLYTYSEDKKWKECDNQMISLYDYEKLKAVADKVPSSEKVYVVARVFQSKSTGNDICEIAVGDWDKFTNLKQPTEAEVIKYNLVQKGKDLVDQYKKQNQSN